MDSKNRISALISEKERDIDRLNKELHYEEQKLNAELNEKQIEKDEMLRFQVAKRKEMEENHSRTLH